MALYKFRIIIIINLGEEDCIVLLIGNLAGADATMLAQDSTIMLYLSDEFPWSSDLEARGRLRLALSSSLIVRRT